MMDGYTSSVFSVLFQTIIGAVSVFLESQLLDFLLPLQSFRKRGQKLVEYCAIGLVFLANVLLMGLRDALIKGELMDLIVENIQTFASISTVVLAGSQLGKWRENGSHLVFLAGVAAHPAWNEWYSCYLILALLLIRQIWLLPGAWKEERQKLSSHSIQEGIDSLEDGIMIYLPSGEPVLANLAMVRFTEEVLATRVRNGNILWHLLQEGGQRKVSMQRQGKGLLYTLTDGRKVLFRRIGLNFGKKFRWQMTASDVTELVQVNRNLTIQNNALSRRNRKIRELLGDVQELQTRETLQEMRSRIHDLMGQRISLLQQVLNNKDAAGYRKIMPLVENLFTDVKKEIRVDPKISLEELIALYGDLGVTIQMHGVLPNQENLADLYLKCIREALTNAICHGHADRIFLDVGEHSLLIRDNGIGCAGPVREGSGLSGIRNRVERAGGTVRLRGMPHFSIALQFEGKEGENDDSTVDRR
jgi:hypothetical protein